MSHEILVFMVQVIQRLPHKINQLQVPKSILALIILLGSFSTTLIFALLAYQIYFLDKVYLGVWVDGVDVSTYTKDQVYTLVENQAQLRVSQSITLESPEGRWQFSAQDLGLGVDVQNTVERVYAVGRRGSFWGDLREQFILLEQPLMITPKITYDPNILSGVLEQIAKDFDRPVIDAKLFINTNLKVIDIPAQVGRRLDLEIGKARIEQALASDQAQIIPLKVDYSTPKLTQVENLARNLQTLLSTPLVFRYDDQAWHLAPETLADMILIKTQRHGQGQGMIQAEFDRQALQDFLEPIGDALQQSSIDARFHFDLSSQRLIPLQESQPGLRLDISATIDQVTALIESPESLEITLPMIVEAPRVSSENPETLGLKNLLHQETSYFKGSSSERMQNIKVAAAKFHGLVVPPGETFSFNDHLGPVTAANGFVEGLIISGDRTAVGIGGGVCQVSTTIFRTAFFSGLEIVERWAHGYRVSWYETNSLPGLDATIYSPQVDFKFRNDTDSFILIQSYTDVRAGTLSFNFYGQATGRSVLVSEPIISNIIARGPDIYEVDPNLPIGAVQQLEWPKDGMDVQVARTVSTSDGQILHQDTIFSRYRPWQARFKIGPKPEPTPEASPEPEPEATPDTPLNIAAIEAPIFQAPPVLDE